VVVMGMVENDNVDREQGQAREVLQVAYFTCRILLLYNSAQDEDGDDNVVFIF
jgi:hypothetical protein